MPIKVLCKQAEFFQLTLIFKVILIQGTANKSNCNKGARKNQLHSKQR